MNISLQGVDLLVDTLVILCNPNTKILMSYEVRDDKREIYQSFFDLMKDKFTWEKIPTSKQHPDFCSHDIALYCFLRTKS